MWSVDGRTLTHDGQSQEQMIVFLNEFLASHLEAKGKEAAFIESIFCQTNEQGFTLAHICIQDNRLEILKRILGYVGSFRERITDKSGDSLFHFGCSYIIYQKPDFVPHLI